MKLGSFAANEVVLSDDQMRMLRAIVRERDPHLLPLALESRAMVCPVLPESGMRIAYCEGRHFALECPLQEKSMAISRVIENQVSSLIKTGCGMGSSIGSQVSKVVYHASALNRYWALVGVKTRVGDREVTIRSIRDNRVSVLDQSGEIVRGLKCSDLCMPPPIAELSLLLGVLDRAFAERRLLLWNLSSMNKEMRGRRKRVSENREEYKPKARKLMGDLRPP